MPPRLGRGLPLFSARCHRPGPTLSPSRETRVCPVLDWGRKGPGIHQSSPQADPIPHKEGLGCHRRWPGPRGARGTHIPPCPLLGRTSASMVTSGWGGGRRITCDRPRPPCHPLAGERATPPLCMITTTGQPYPLHKGLGLPLALGRSQVAAPWYTSLALMGPNTNLIASVAARLRAPPPASHHGGATMAQDGCWEVAVCEWVPATCGPVLSSLGHANYPPLTTQTCALCCLFCVLFLCLCFPCVACTVICGDE